MKYALGNMLNGAGGLNPDGLSLDLQFATDKTLTARKGPTPVFTRSSGDNRGTTYFGPSSINAIFTFDGTGFNVNMFQSTLLNGRYRWENGDTVLSYTGTAWSLSQDGNAVATSALTSAFRPDGANWSGTAAVVTATSTLGIVRAANNEPRFDHDPVTGVCKGLLIEESRTNIILQSEDFGTTWSNDSGAVTITTDVETSPDGSTSADKIAEAASTTSRRICIQNITVTSGTTYSYSCYIKAGERDFAQLATGSGLNTAFQNFIVNGAGAGTLGLSSGIVSSRIDAMPNGWYRCTIVVTATATGATTITVGPAPSSTITRWQTYASTAGSGIYAWGAQLEAGSFPTSYIPTTTASVIRSADVCDVIGADVHPSVGTLVVEFDRRTLNSAIFRSPGRVLASASATAADYVGIDHNDTQIRTPIRAANATVSTLAFNNTSIGTTKTAVAWSSGDSSHVSGGVVRISTSAAIAFANPLDTISFCGIAPNAICTTIARITYYKKRLPNAKLQSLTV